jgi:hypothetical protein
VLVLGRNDIVLLLSALVFNLNHGIYLYFFLRFSENKLPFETFSKLALNDRLKGQRELVAVSTGGRSYNHRFKRR